MYAPVVNATLGVEEATFYELQWSTSAGFESVVGSLTIQAQGTGNPMCFVSGLTNGTPYYFRMRAKVGSTPGAWGSVYGPVTPSIATGNYTVTGTINLPVTPTGPLYVALVDEANGRFYITRIGTPTITQAYSLSGVLAGTYQLYAILDQNQNGIIDPGDLSNTAGHGLGVQVTGDLSNVSLSLDGEACVAQLRTSHWQIVDSVDEGYTLNFGVRSLVKLPVAVTLQLGPHGYVDLGTRDDGERYQFWVGCARPTVGDSYPMTVTYSDGTTETRQPAVTGVLDCFPRNLLPRGSGSGNVTPTFTWLAPTNPPPFYTYGLWIGVNNGGQVWSYWDMPSTQTSVLYNVDGEASQPTLTVGTTYRWGLNVIDANGNEAQAQATYTP